MIKKLALFLGYFTGLIFVCSGYIKLFPIESLEYTIVDTTHLPWYLAAWASRLLIAFEIGLGVFILLNIYRKCIFYVGVTTLMIFNGYLLYLGFTKGLNADCGCFGEWFALNPIESLLKNTLLLAGLWLNFKFRPSETSKLSVGLGWGLTALVLGWIVFNYPVVSSANPLQKINVPERNLNLLYDGTTNHPPTVELRKGKWVVAFLSATCVHCKQAARKLELIQQLSPKKLPIFLVINGKQANLKVFLEQTAIKNLPYSTFKGPEAFLSMAGNDGLPAVYGIDNGRYVWESTYPVLSKESLEQWLNGKAKLNQ